MITLQEAKEFLRIDGDDEENLIASLIVSAQELTEDILRRPLVELEPLPETIRQAMLIVVATLYEERQVSKDKSGIDIAETIELVKRMLFAYRKERF